MDKQFKERCYTTIYQYMKTKPEVQNLEYPEVRENYDFTCTIGKAECSYSLREDRDLLQNTAVINCETRSTAEVIAFMKDILQDTKSILFTENENTMKMVQSLVFKGVTNETAMETCDTGSKAFYDFLIDHMQDIEDFINGKPVKIEEKPEPPATSSIMANMAMKKPPKKEEPPKEEKPVVREEPAPSVSDEKAAFKQYQKDQELLYSKKEKALKKREKELNEKVKQLQRKEEDLKKIKKENENLKKTLEEDMANYELAKKAMDEREEQIKIDEKEFELAKDAWNKTTPDERLMQRREELQELENAFYEKEKEFQKFCAEETDSILEREKNVDTREKDIAEREATSISKAKEVEERETAVQEKEKELKELEAVLKNKEAEISDASASLKRTEVIRLDAENKAKRLDIVERRLKSKEDELKRLEETLNAEREALQEAKKSIEDKSNDVNYIRTEAMKKEVKINALNKKIEDMSKKIESLESADEAINKMQSELGEAVSGRNLLEEELKKTSDLLDQMKDMYNDANAKLTKKEEENRGLLDKNSELEENIAVIRSELYEAKEILSSRTIPTVEPSGEVQEIPSGVNIEELEALQVELNSAKAELKKMKERNEELDNDNTELRNEYHRKLTEVNEEKQDLMEKLSEKEHALQEYSLSEGGRTVKETDTKYEIPETILASEGINVEEVMGEISGIYSAAYRDCEIFIDTNSKFLAVNKRTRKKNFKKISEVNQRSVEETYYADKHGVHCRRPIKEDIVEEINSVIDTIEEVLG